MSPKAWLPMVVLVYTLCAWLTHKNNTEEGRAWFWLSCAVGVIPAWPIISKYSRNVVFDGILFDIAMTVSYTAAILYFTKSFTRLGCINYFGLALVLGGLFLFKRGT